MKRVTEFNGWSVQDIGCNGKAKVIRYCDTELLVSYGTIVIYNDMANGVLWRVWEGWSVTTQKHIAAQYAMNKAAFVELPIMAVDHIPYIETLKGARGRDGLLWRLYNSLELKHVNW